MKKCILFLATILFLSGCSTNKAVNAEKNISDDLVNSDSYTLEGKMNIIGDEEIFDYTLKVNFLKDDYFKVTLNNITNNHEQIILKNDDGVYVITPSINKSFKFQSSWPNNSSQPYLLESILKDITTDKNKKYSDNKDGYIIKTKVNYPNNSSLTYEKIYFDKNGNLKKVVVYDAENKERIIVDFLKIDFNDKLSKDDFKLDEYFKSAENKTECEGSNCEQTTVNILEDIIYPLYLPGNTYLTSSERIENDDESRVILTFNGDRTFTIVEEALNVSNNFEVSPVYGDPVLLNDTIGVMEDNSIKWNRGNISYYLTSNNLSSTEMATIASSMNHAKSVLESK